jgi:hypothetical protein
MQMQTYRAWEKTVLATPKGKQEGGTDQATLEWQRERLTRVRNPEGIELIVRKAVIRAEVILSGMVKP